MNNCKIISIFAGINRHLTLYLFAFNDDQCMTLKITPTYIAKIHNHFQIATAIINEEQYHKININSDRYESLSNIINIGDTSMLHGEFGNTPDEAIDKFVKKLLAYQQV